MAYPDFEETEFAEATEPSAVISTTMGWIGAAASVALLGGLGWWSYDLATRDTRAIPVIAAMEGPARQAPDNPGGFQAANQGLTVTEVSEASEDGLPAQVTLAPQATPLHTEDQPIPAMRPKVEEQGLRDAVNSAVQDALLSSEAEPPVAAAPSAAPAVLNGVPRPRPRPDVGIVSRAAAPTSALALTPVSLDLAPEDVPAGLRLVQLGAYDSPETARSEWERIADRFGPYFDGRQRVIERAEVGGKTFYRLRVAAFDDLPAARRFCAALTAERTDCIPVPLG